MAKKNESEQAGVEPQKPQEFVPRIYWSRADMYRIANYVAEIKRSGNIDQREISIEFKQHIRTAYTQHETDYIEGHKGYGVECKRVNSMEEATALTFQQDLERGQVRSKPITTAIIDDEETTADKPTPVNRQTMMSEAAAGQG